MFGHRVRESDLLVVPRRFRCRHGRKPRILAAGVGRWAMILLILLGLSSRVHAQGEPPVASGRVQLDLVGSYGGPWGPAGLALAYDWGGRLALGLAVGTDAESFRGNSAPPVGAFARIRAWRSGPWAVGVTASLSRRTLEIHKEYQRPHWIPEGMIWTWAPGYRADAAAMAEWVGTSWSLRLEAGLGYFLNSPTCYYYGGTSYEGDCTSPRIPAAYHYSVAPGRLSPSVALAVGYRFGGGGAAKRGPTGPHDWTPLTWTLAVALGDVIGVGVGLIGAGGLGALTHSGCGRQTEEDPFCGVEGYFIGAVLGVAAGVTTGVYAVGRGSHRSDGSFAWTLIGTLEGMGLAAAGTLLTWAAFSGSADQGLSTGVSAALLFSTLPALGAIRQYRRTSSPVVNTMALFQVDPVGGLSTAVPPVSVTRHQGVSTFSVPLLGGTF
jgi:hypothetical protein